MYEYCCIIGVRIRDNRLYLSLPLLGSKFRGFSCGIRPGRTQSTSGRVRVRVRDIYPGWYL